MNRKQFFILIVALALIGAAGWIVYQRRNNSWQNATQSIGGKLLPNLPINNIAQITIQSGTNHLTLAKQNGTWRVHERDDYPANFSQISDLLVKLADLKIAQTEEVGVAELGRFDLLPVGTETNSGTLVEFKDQKGKTLNSLLLGKNHMRQSSGSPQFGNGSWPDGRYVIAGGAKTVALISDTLDNLAPNPVAWLDKSFLQIEKPRAISLQFSDATNSWKLTRASGTNDWQLADAKSGEKLDSSKLDEVISPFNSPSFTDVSSGGVTETNATVLTVSTFDGFTYIAKIGTKDGNDYPVSFSVAADFPKERAPAKDEKPAEKSKLDADFKLQQKTLAEKLAKEKRLENWTYKIPTYAVDSFLKTWNQLLVQPKAKEGTTSKTESK